MRKLAVVGAALVVVIAGCGSSAAPPAAVPTTAGTTTTIPAPTTTVPTAPPGEFLVVSLASGPAAYSSTPGGAAAGTLTATSTWGESTVLPVVSQSGDWVQVSLPTRPNGSTGWVPRSSVTFAATPFQIVVSISQRRVTLYKDGAVVYTALVGVGAPQYPTPMGTTFVDAIVATPQSQLYIYGPTVLILGTHSNVLTDFDHGDGTVAIHGYPSDPASTEGVAESHGCVRASPAVINALKVVPLGTPVDVEA